MHTISIAIRSPLVLPVNGSGDCSEANKHSSASPPLFALSSAFVCFPCYHYYLSLPLLSHQVPRSSHERSAKHPLEES